MEGLGSMNLIFFLKTLYCQNLLWCPSSLHQVHCRGPPSFLLWVHHLPVCLPVAFFGLQLSGETAPNGSCTYVWFPVKTGWEKPLPYLSLLCTSYICTTDQVRTSRIPDTPPSHQLRAQLLLSFTGRLHALASVLLPSFLATAHSSFEPLPSELPQIFFHILETCGFWWPFLRGWLQGLISPDTLYGQGLPCELPPHLLFPASPVAPAVAPCLRWWSETGPSSSCHFWGFCVPPSGLFSSLSSSGILGVTWNEVSIHLLPRHSRLGAEGLWALPNEIF